MRILTTLAMLLAMALPTLGAQTWPAGTNVANIFFRTNQFREATSFGVVHTNIITDGGSKINGVGFTNGIMTGDIRGSTQDGDIPFTFGNNGVLGYDPGIFYYETNSGSLHAPYFYGIGSNLVYIQATSIWGVLDNTNIPSPLTLGQINVGTLVLTNPPVLDLSASTNLNGSALFYQTNVSTPAPNFFLPYSIFTTNAAFAFLAPLNVSLTNAQTAVVLVTNSAGAGMDVTPPANVHTQGTWRMTNLATFTFFNYGGTFTNAIAFPLW